MNPQLLGRVRELRARNPYHPLGIQAAFGIARYEQRDPAQVYPQYPFLNEVAATEMTVHGRIDIDGQKPRLAVKIEIKYDQDSELGEDDVTGKFVWQQSEWTIKNTRRDWGSDTEFYEIAPIRRTETWRDYSKLGMSRSVAHEAQRAAVEQDMREDSTRTYYGMIVTIAVRGQEIGSASLWGIDTVDGYDGDAYFVDQAAELIEEALSIAKESGPHRVEKARKDADRLAGVVERLVAN